VLINCGALIWLSLPSERCAFIAEQDGLTMLSYILRRLLYAIRS